MPPFKNPLESHESGSQHLITIDRSKLFSPNESSDPLLHGLELIPNDQKSLEIEKLDLDKVKFQIIAKGESPEFREGLEPEQKYLSFLKMLDENGHRIYPDAKIFEMLKNNPALIPEEWKLLSIDNKAAIIFDGSTFKSEDGDYYQVVLYYSELSNSEREYDERRAFKLAENHWDSGHSFNPTPPKKEFKWRSSLADISSGDYYD